VQQAGPSSATGLRYRFAQQAAPGAAHAWTSLASVDVASPLLGGDTGFVKAAWDGALTWSWRRFAPDTGFAAPWGSSAHAAHRARVAAARAASRDAAVTAPSDDAVDDEVNGSSSSSSAPGAAAGLAPHPGPGGVLPGWLVPDAAVRLLPVRDRAQFTWADRLAGWLSAGVTVRVDAGAGLLVPTATPARGAAPAGAPPRSHILDRFFLSAGQFRGFVDGGVGPRAAASDARPTAATAALAGSDALGGDVLAFVSTRVQLPPPLPFVSLANAGVRSHVFGGVGLLAPGTSLDALLAPLRAPRPFASLAGRAAAAVREAVTSLPAALGHHVAAAWGVGVSVPMGAVGALEMNLTLGHRVPPASALGPGWLPDVALRFKLQFAQ
jgi:hypothetical protein